MKQGGSSEDKSSDKKQSEPHQSHPQNVKLSEMPSVQSSKSIEQ